MKCYSEEILQHFYDGECKPDEQAGIEEHLVACPGCRKQLDTIAARSTNIKEAFNTLITNKDEPIEIPEFIKPMERQNNGRKRLVWMASAASVIGFIISLHFIHQNNNSASVSFYQPMESSIDANQTISDQEITMQYIDESGNILNLDSNLF